MNNQGSAPQYPDRPRRRRRRPRHALRLAAVAVLLVSWPPLPAQPGPPAGITPARTAANVTALDAGVGSAPAVAPRDAGWAWPVGDTPAGPVVARPFHPPAQRWLSGHRGVDLVAPAGARVVAPTGGTVSFAGAVAGRGVLTLRTPEGLRLSFEPLNTARTVGDRVGRGETLGTLGSPTHCGAGPPGRDSCLHWGVRRGEFYLDPLGFMLELRPSVLLPLLPVTTP